MPLSVEQHLLVKLGEEAAEVQQIVAKALRFGGHEIWENALGNPEGLTNLDRIQREVEDLITVYNMLIDRGVLKSLDRLRILDNRARVHKYMKMSTELGMLEGSY